MGLSNQTSYWKPGVKIEKIVVTTIKNKNKIKINNVKQLRKERGNHLPSVSSIIFLSAGERGRTMVNTKPSRLHDRIE
jgi:hypothetical protein